MPRAFLHAFSNAFQALLSVEFHIVPKSLSSNGCLIYEPNKSSFFHLGLTYFGKYLLKQAIPSLYLSIAFTNILSNSALYPMEANRFLTYPLKQDVPHSSDLVLLLKGVAFFLYSVVAVPRGCPIHIKSSRI